MWLEDLVAQRCTIVQRWATRSISRIKVERFHGALERALDRRGPLPAEPQLWLDDYRWEHNHLRPHEALAMQVPASRWQPSPRRYNPNPPRCEYPQGAWVLKIDCQGKLDLKGRKWHVSRALAGEYVQLLPIQQRLMVFFGSTLMREIDLVALRSTIVQRWATRSSNHNRNVTDVPGQSGTHVVSLDKTARWMGHPGACV